MKVFVRKLPRNSTSDLLRDFVEGAISPRWYRPFDIKGSVKNCVILRIKDLDTGEVEFHGLVDIHPVKAALAAIQKLNMKRFEGHYVEVRKWYVRSSRADRRSRFARGKDVSDEDRRSKDRRRSNIVIDTYVPIKIKGLKGFHRQYGG